MPRQHTEATFESAIEDYLLTEGGYIQGQRASFDTERGLDPIVLLDFVQETQPQEWEYLQSIQGEAAGETLLDELRAERTDQQSHASPATLARWGREMGADYILQGVINSIVDREGNQQVVFYQTDLELTDLETNEKVWVGTKKIKKLVRN